ncbi:MAG: sugar ABC transporter permease [Clostridia bacterium]|nr:sugar ABC transporter permease [Clostridia bacterium]
MRPAAAASPKRTGIFALLKKEKYREYIAGYLFIAPLIVYFIVFQITPMAMSLLYSFTEWNMRTKPTFVGLRNYVDLFTNTLFYPMFWPSLWITLKYILMITPISLTIPLLLALILNTKVKGQAFFRTAFYIPVVTPGVAQAALWKWILDPKFGLLNAFIRNTPLINRLFSTHSWLNETRTALPVLAVMGAWGGLGYNILIYLAGLKAIPDELYESAYVDGANSANTLIHITLPMLKPTIFFLLVTGLIGNFQVFDQMYLLTGGGPNDSTLSYVLSLYNHAFRYYEMGIACSMSYILLSIILIITLLNFKFVPQTIDD